MEVNIHGTIRFDLGFILWKPFDWRDDAQYFKDFVGYPFVIIPYFDTTEFYISPICEDNEQELREEESKKSIKSIVESMRSWITGKTR
jgi:hypothetical protein